MITFQATTSDREITLATEIAERYQLASLQPLIDSSRALTERNELSVAVIGRFKAGKSSFLNHFLNRELLPVGVTPSLLAVDLPQLAEMRALRFIDMPGLESALTHNTEVAMSWLPNVALALVAVSVDPPLSEHDVALLKRVYDYTPNVSILLTKVDLLTESERAEVMNFVHDRLAHTFGSAPPIFPYSIRPGYEDLKGQIQDTLINGTLEQFEEQRNAVLKRKLETLLRECHDYLALALKSAESDRFQREALERQVASEKASLQEMKSELRLVIRYAAGGVREAVAKRLERHKRELDASLSSELRTRFPDWTRSLRLALESFEQWLGDSLSQEMMAISGKERLELLAPLEKLKKQGFRSLQNFRDRLSDRTERAFGIPLRTTESEIVIDEPRTPDIYIGKIFDRNWEMLSVVAPMLLFGPLVRRHFMRRVPSMTERNLSRQVSQWDESIRAAMMQILREAERRLDELVATVERLFRTSSDEAPKIRADIERIQSCLDGLGNSLR